MEIYECPHENCDIVCPVNVGFDAKRWMHTHARRFKDHRCNKDSCIVCKLLYVSGEWTKSGGFDSLRCSHIGCRYFSTAKRLANRKQAIKRHEEAFPIHKTHFAICGGTCATCVDLVARGVWTPDDITEVSEIVRKRIETKALFNCLTGDEFTVSRVTETVNLPQQPLGVLSDAANKKRKAAKQLPGKRPKKHKTLWVTPLPLSAQT